MSKQALSVRVGGIVLLTLITYLPVMLRGGWIWDDDVYVTRNATLQSAAGLGQIWANSAPEYNKQYYPLVHTAFWMEYHLWGLKSAAPYHVDNVLLHALNAVLVWLILRRLAVPGAWVIAAIFAVHPLETESVAWVTERKNVLSAMFYLLALGAYLRFARIDQPVSPRLAGGNHSPSWGLYVLSLLLFVCALLSKSVTCSLPVVILLLVWWKTGRISWRDVWPLAPFVAVGAVLGLHTAYMERVVVGAHGAAWEIGSVERCLIAGRALWFYVGKLLWPSPLMFIYPRWDVSRAIWWQYLFPAAWLALLVTLFALRKRIGRGPLVAVLYYSISLFPALGFVNTYPMMYSFVADHFQYLGGIGVMALAVGAVAVLARRYGLPARVPGYAGGALIVALVMVNIPQGMIYQDLPVTASGGTGVIPALETLWADTHARNPDAAIACEGLGSVYANSGRFDDAIPLLKRATELNPSWVNGYMNLGIVYEAAGKPGLALAAYEEGLRVPPEDTGAEANLLCADGALLAKDGKNAGALAAFEKAIAADPKNALALGDAGLMYVGRGGADDLKRAEADLLQSMEYRPSCVPAHLGLGYLCAKRGDFAAAQQHFTLALLLEPGNTSNLRRLAIAIVRGGRAEESLAAIGHIMAMAGADEGLHDSLAKAVEVCEAEQNRGGPLEMDVPMPVRPGSVAGGG